MGQPLLLCSAELWGETTIQWDMYDGSESGVNISVTGCSNTRGKCDGSRSKSWIYFNVQYHINQD